jgi:dolichol kinase
MNAFELRRKILHIMLGLAVILLSAYYPRAKWVLFYTIIIGIALSLVSIHARLPVIGFMLDKFERPYYRKVFPGKGPLFFIAGSLFVLKLFPSSIALASIAIATFSDPFFSFDKRILKGIFKTKNLRSFLLGLFAGTISASFFILPFYALIATFCAAIVESAAIFLGTDPVDDNIIIPVSAGTVLYVISVIL